MLSSTGDCSSSFPYWLSFCFIFRLAAGVLIFVFLTLQNRWVYGDTEWLLLDCLDLNIRHGWIPNVVSKFIMGIDYVVSANFLIQCASIVYDVAS